MRPMLGVLTLLAACGGQIDTTKSDTEVEASESESEIEAEPVPDYSSYTMDGRMQYDVWGDSYDCDETFTEVGVLVEDEELSELCVACDYFYEYTYDVDELCGWIEVNSELQIKGLVLDADGGWAQVYRISENNGWGGDGELQSELWDDGASFDGWELTWEQSDGISGTIYFDEQ